MPIRTVIAIRMKLASGLAAVRCLPGRPSPRGRFQLLVGRIPSRPWKMPGRSPSPPTSAWKQDSGKCRRPKAHMPRRVRNVCRR